MPASWIAVGVGLTACAAHVVLVRTGIARLLASRSLRGRLGPSSVEVLYVAGTVAIAGVSGVVVLSTLGTTPSPLGSRTWWIWCAAITLTVAVVVLPWRDVREPSGLRRLLLCLGGGAEEVLWRGVAVVALAQLGLGAVGGSLLATAGFVAIHTARYGRRGALFILLLSLLLSALALTAGLLCAVAAHVAWNAWTGLRPRRAVDRPAGAEPVRRPPADEW